MTSLDPTDPDPDARADAAREQLVRLKVGQPTPEELAEAAAWRAADARNEAAYRRAEATWRLLGERPPMERPVRRPPLHGPLAAAAALALAVGLGAFSLPAGGLAALAADLRTAPGQRLAVTLADGSRLELDGGTALDYDLGKGRRRVKVLAGQALIQAAPDDRRPLDVEAGDADIRVFGGRILVARADDRVGLVVCDGRVWAGAGVDLSPLAAGETRAWEGGEAGEAPRVEVSDVEAWRRGRWVFRDAPLSQATDQIARATGAKIWLVGPRARRARLTAVFDASDPSGVLRRLGGSLPIRVLRPAPGLVVIV